MKTALLAVLVCFSNLGVLCGFASSVETPLAAATERVAKGLADGTVTLHGYKRSLAWEALLRWGEASGRRRQVEWAARRAFAVLPNYVDERGVVQSVSPGPGPLSDEKPWAVQGFAAGDEHGPFAILFAALGEERLRRAVSRRRSRTATKSATEQRCSVLLPVFSFGSPRYPHLWQFLEQNLGPPLSQHYRKPHRRPHQNKGPWLRQPRYSIRPDLMCGHSFCFSLGLPKCHRTDGLR